MYKNNLNNKFGECCNCPALSTGQQYFTNYESSRLYNDKLRKNLSLNDTHSFRLNLQQNGLKYISNENIKITNDKCSSNTLNNFYLDGSTYNFSTKLINEYTGPKLPNNYIKKSNMQSL